MSCSLEAAPWACLAASPPCDRLAAADTSRANSPPCDLAIASTDTVPPLTPYLFPCRPPRQVPLFGFAPNGTFGLGAALVVASIFLYAWTPKPTAGVSNYVPVASGEPRQGSPSKV